MREIRLSGSEGGLPGNRLFLPISTVRDCMTNWPGVKESIENGLQEFLPVHPKWQNPLGPKNFLELVAKTYEGAAMVDT